MTDELFTLDEKRKYLTTEEQGRFVAAANAHECAEVLTFWLTLAYTGCRISGALELTPERIDLSDKSITFRTLKQRNKVNTARSPALTPCSMPSSWCIASVKYGARQS